MADSPPTLPSPTRSRDPSTTSAELALVEPKALLMRIEAFLADPAFAEDTKRTYRSALMRFAEFVEGRTFASPRDAVVDFVRELMAQGGAPGVTQAPPLPAPGASRPAPSPAPIAHHLSPSPALRPNTIHLYKAAVTSFLAHQGVVVGKIKGARRSRRFLKDALEPEEVRKMMDVWKGDRPDAVRNRAIIALLATTGLRQIEAWRADVEDLQTMEGTRALIVQGKGEEDKNNFVVIGDEAWLYLRDWLKVREKILRQSERVDEWSSGQATEKHSPPPPSNTRPLDHSTTALFVTCGQRNFGKRMTRVALRWVLSESIRRAGLKDTGKRVSGHSLRHTFVTTYLQGGGNLLKAQEAARHADPATTQVYMDKLDRLKDPPEKEVSKAVLGNSELNAGRRIH